LNALKSKPSTAEQLMSENSILIIDSNEAFATILKEGLEQGSEYHATVTSSGDEALQALSHAEFELVIVDLGLTDPDGVAFARTLREQRPDQRLMLIPFMGEGLPSELADLDIQGVLTKPFFFPELPGIVGKALGRELDEGPSIEVPPPPIEEMPAIAETLAPTEAPPIAAPPPAVQSVEPAPADAERLAEVRKRITEKRMQRIVQAMNSLALDINAEAVILTCAGGLLAHAGRLADDKANELARIVGENWHTSAQVAKILGRRQRRFEQSVEGGEHMFYSLTISEDIVLSAALSNSVPLGMIRHSAKSTADALRQLV
jgi:CheY-like chemotaxis protein